jgi:NO-binding membrane sensor protein with MHYT domain
VEYRLLVLALRMLLGATFALLGGLSLFFIGSVTIVPLITYNLAVVTANLVIGAGLGAGLAGWFFGLRVGTSRRPSRYEAPLVFSLALACAWLGFLFLSDTVFRNVDAVRVKSTNEVYGALAGAIAGAMAVPLAVGVWRAARRLEP